MNWVGGVRNRLKTQHEKKLQQEFFEKKRFNKKVEKAKSKPCRSDKKLTISQDLQSLKTIERIYCSTDKKKDTETKHKTKRPVKEVPLANTPRSRLDLNCNLDLHMSPCKEPSKIAIMDPRSSAQWKLPDSIKAPRPPHCDIEPIRSGHAQYNLTSNSTRYRQTRLGPNQYESSPNDLTRDNRSVNIHSGITGSDITARREISYDAHQAKIGYNSTLQLNKPVIQNADLDNDISMYSDIFRGSDKYETPWLSHKYGGPNVTLSINSNRGHSTVTSGDLEQRDNAIRVPKRPLPQFASDMKRQEEENFQETPLRKYKKHRDCSKHKHTVDYNSLYDDEQYICKNYTPEYAPEVRNTSSRRNIQQKKKVESTPVSDPSPSYMLGLRKLLLGNTPQKRPTESPPQTPVVYKPNIQNTDLQRDKYTKPINSHKTTCNVIGDDCHKSEKKKLTTKDQSSAPNFQSHGIRKDDTTDKTQNSAIGQKKQGEHVQKKDVQEKEQSCTSEKADEAIIEKHSKDKKSQHIQLEQPKQLNILMQCNKVSSKEKELEHNSPVNQPIKQHRGIGSQTSPIAHKKRIVKLYANNATQTDISFINTKNKSIQCEPLTSECNIQVNIGDVRMTPTNIVHSTSSEEVSVIATNVEDSADASAGSNEEEELVADDSGSTSNSLKASEDDIDISPTPKQPAEHGNCIVDSTNPIDIRNNRTPNIMVDQVNMPSTPSYKDRPVRPLSSSVDDSGIVSPVSTYASSVGIPDANATLSPSGAHDVTADLSLCEQQMSKMTQSSNATLYSQGTPPLNASPLNTVADLQGTPPADATLNASDNNQYDEDSQEVEFITCEVKVNPRDKGESDKITGDVRACQL